MNINASILDQQVLALVNSNPWWLEYLESADEHKKKSAAFVVLSMSLILDIPQEDAGDYLTDGSGDAGVDGIYISDVEDGTFSVMLFQGKYKKNLEGKSGFPSNDIVNVINTIKCIFNPSAKLTVNEKLTVRIEEVRSLVNEGYIPSVKVYLCINGQHWEAEGDEHIENSGFNEHASFHLFNHDNFVALKSKSKTTDATIQLAGPIIQENFDFRRVLIGRIPVVEIKKLFETHGDNLLEKNVRRYLGLHKNRVNNEIFKTLEDQEKRKDFYFLNNGITMICHQFKHSGLIEKDVSVVVKDMQIINGGQTSKTIEAALSKFEGDSFGNVSVLFRLYEIGDGEDDFINSITYATNSQNPVELRDLRANDGIQRALSLDLEGLGYQYKTKRDGQASSGKIIPITVAGPAVLAVINQKPHWNKTRAKEIFGKFYDQIFKQVNAAQIIVAVTIFRLVENERKRPSIFSQRTDKYVFIPYASYFIAMELARILCESVDIPKENISHLNLERILDFLRNSEKVLYKTAVESIQQKIQYVYAGALSLQKLAAAFRRPDLCDEILKTKPNKLQPPPSFL